MAIYAATFLACFLYMAAAYPGGAPPQACDTFRPNHVHHSTRQPIKAQNENDNLDLDDSVCPYEVSYSSSFVPGNPITLTIKSRDTSDYFRGYMLAVVSVEGDVVEAKGQLDPSANIICGGNVVTQSNGSRKTEDHIEWTAPADSSKQKFEVWMTVVKSFSRYWMNCSPIMLPAFDAVDDDGTTTTLASFALPTEVIETENNRTSIFAQPGSKDNSTESFEKFNDDIPDDIDADKKDLSSSSMMESSSSLIESVEDPDSVGQDESGNSIENSVDVSDNRSGSSLNSDEKEQKRKQYFEEGIENFDSDIKKFLVAVDKESVYEQFRSSCLTCAAPGITGLTTLITLAVAMLALA